MLDYRDNNFLARWLSGEISEEEKQRFEKTDDYLAFKDILNATDKFEKPVFDIEKNLIEQKKFNQVYKEKKPRVIALKPWIYAAAAIVIVLISVKIFTPKSTIIFTEMAQIQTITLPDNSVVSLNANSSIEYDKKNFSEQRQLKLKGQAFFKVAKGSKFTVITENGDISVLGTQFDVFSRIKKLEVHCYEGKVLVANQNDKAILVRGKAVKSNANQKMLLFDIQNQNPSWIDGISSFKEVELQEVINELEIQFDIKIKSKNINTKRLFTGFFDHNDINKALQTCFEPMNINYTFINNKTIELQNK